MILVADSSALIALLKAEPGAAIVRDAIDDPGNSVFMHSVNLCEVYYDTVREFGEEPATEIITKFLSTCVIPREDMDPGFWKQAGLYKAHLKHISLADCFCLALATRTDAELVTADHEFDQVAEQGLCRVRFIR